MRTRPKGLLLELRALAGTWRRLAVVWCCLALPVFAPAIQAQVEAFRARIVLLPGGTVSLSTDGGNRYTVVGRVVALPQRLNKSNQPRGSAVYKGTGVWVIQHSEDQSVGLTASSVSSPTALRTDMSPDSALFRGFKIPISAKLLLQEGRVAYSLPPGYRYRLGDVWVLQVLAADEEQADSLRQSIADALPGESHDAERRSVQRAEAANLSVVTGTLNLEVTARYAQRARFVYFSVDGYPVGTSNVLPTVFRWDSTQVPDGEYILEARALDADGRELALVRKRVLVRNSATPGSR